MRIVTLIGLIILGSILGGIYGAFYDQITYTISPEFFTRFRFPSHEFNIDGNINPRIGAAIVGFMNTWKTGLVIAIVLSAAGMINADPKRMFRFTMQAFFITLVIAFVVGMIGWTVGPLPGQLDPDESLKVVNKEAFKAVVNMNNFSNAGGVIGMFIGVFYQLYRHKRMKVKGINLQGNTLTN